MTQNNERTPCPRNRDKVSNQCAPTEGAGLTLVGSRSEATTKFSDFKKVVVVDT